MLMDARNPMTCSIHVSRPDQKTPLGFSVVNAGKWLKVVVVDRNSIAARAGLQSGDILVDCDEVSATGATHKLVLENLRKAVTPVDVCVLRKAAAAAPVVSTAAAESAGRKRSPRRRGKKTRLQLKPAHVFAELNRLLTPELVEQIDGVFQLNVLEKKAHKETWTLDLKAGRVFAGVGVDTADVAVTLSQGTLSKWLNRELSAYS